MPIQGRTLHEAAQTFCDHINGVLSKTITQTRVVAFGVRGSPRIEVTLRQAGQPIKARLNTRFGPIGFYIGQVCESVLTPNRQHELRTVKYTYTLTPEGVEEPLLRWEYVRSPGPEDLWCRHHLQGPIEFRINRYAAILNDMHLPTGYVPFEEVLRFCTVDLEVSPLSDDWDQTLKDSYERFKAEFTQ